MYSIPGRTSKDTCDGITRRDLLRVGGSAMLGMTLGNIFRLQASAAEPMKNAGPGFGKAKSVIMVYLQGGPSHLDLWDPKENVPEKIRSAFKPIPTKIPGINFTEVLPQMNRRLR